MRAAAESAGRDPTTLGLQCGVREIADPAAQVAAAREFAALGATHAALFTPNTGALHAAAAPRRDHVLRRGAQVPIDRPARPEDTELLNLSRAVSRPGRFAAPSVAHKAHPGRTRWQCRVRRRTSCRPAPLSCSPMLPTAGSAPSTPSWRRRSAAQAPSARCSRTPACLRYFFGKLAKSPDAILPADVLADAHGVGLSGKEPSAITIGARIACVSSFFKFLIRMEQLDRNPCDALERPKTPQPTPRGLTAEQVQRLLAIIPNTPVGLRDRAIILTLLLTGRRRSEVLNLTVDEIEPGDSGLLHLPGERWHARTARAAPTGLRGPCRGAVGVRSRAGGDAARRVDLAHVGRHGRRVERHGPRQLPALPASCGASAGWIASLAPYGRQAAPGCRGVDRGREPLLGPLDPGRDHDVSAPPRRRAGCGLAAGGGNSRPRDQLIRLGAIATILPPICAAAPTTCRDTQSPTQPNRPTTRASVACTGTRTREASRTSKPLRGGSPRRPADSAPVLGLLA